jgi:hypothetical protein
MRKKKARPKLRRAEKVSSTTASLHRELNTGKPHHTLKVLKLLRIKMRSFLKFCLSTLKRSFHGTFVDLLFTDRMFSQHTHPVTFDLRETASHRQPLSLPVLRHTQLAMFDLCEQRNVSGKNPDLAFNRGDDDRIDRVGIHPRFRSDDFKSQWHGGKGKD